MGPATECAERRGHSLGVALRRRPPHRQRRRLLPRGSKRGDSGLDVLGRAGRRLSDVPLYAGLENSGGGGGEVSERLVTFSDVSKFYGEVLGVNRVNLSIPPGITSLVGPNGSGKTTLMNLMTGLIRPSRGSIRILDLTSDQPEQLFRIVGYCTQFDSFPKGLSGYEFLYSYLLLFGYDRARCDELAWKAISAVGLNEAAHRKVAGYSKGM